VFAARGIGGAERSMLRLMANAHPATLDCRVIVPAPENLPLRRAAAEVGVPYHALHPLNLVGLYRRLRRDRPDVVYVFGRFRTILWALVARLAGLRCIVAAERSAANRKSDRLARRLDRFLVTAYVANSEFAARNLRGILGASGPPVSVVPNGVETSAQAGRLDRGSDPPSLLCVGNITPNKGQGVLLEAVRLLRDRYPGIRAILVGHDFTRGRFFAEARARGLDDTYEALGFAEDVGSHLARATIAVLPTLMREGMPTSLLEAMRAGVPVVASRVGGVREIVEDGWTGLLVTPGDARGLAYAVDRLLSDDVVRSRLARNARRRVLERFGLAAMVEGHREAFRNALARTARAPFPREAARGVGPAAAPPVRVAHVTTAAVSLRYLLLNQLDSIRARGYGVTGVSSPGEDTKALEARGIAHHAVPMTRRLTPFRDVLSLLALTRLMRRERFTIVHTHNPKPGLLAQVAARLAGVPVVVNTLHGFYFHDGMSAWARRFYVAVEKLAALCSDVVLSQNEEDVATAVREGIVTPHRIRLLGNGIDLRRFDPGRLPWDTRAVVRASLGIGADALVVGFVGRLVAEKGVPELFEAARLVRERVPNVVFLLVGGADEEKAGSLQPDAARAAGVADVCVFAGVRHDMPELYRSMDVFAMPSHREGFPRAPMEAAAMGLPCVLTDVRGCRQVVTHGRNGFLTKVGDAPALAGALVRLLTTPALARELGAEGRRRALRDFDEQRVFALVLAEYERLLGEKGVALPVSAAPLSAAAGEPTQVDEDVAALAEAGAELAVGTGGRRLR
ncbi:MAG TPA: glycosyltransferase, partial [Vicinamibacteria bacterium]